MAPRLLLDSDLVIWTQRLTFAEWTECEPDEGGVDEGEGLALALGDAVVLGEAVAVGEAVAECEAVADGDGVAVACDVADGWLVALSARLALSVDALLTALPLGLVAS